MNDRGSMSKPATDTHWMKRALALAARGLGETNPNPVVGCVVVRNGRSVGEGWHSRAGGPHAEVVALSRAGARARGATLYVTLEPCAHHGRTPPCAPLVRDSGVARVVVAHGDPSPHASGQGSRLLRRSGVAVSTGVLAAEAARLNERFLLAARSSRPFVLLKAGLTLDGRIATVSGRSRWITSAAQRRQARWLRRLHDAVVVGVGTVLADDPRLLPGPRTRRPFVRVVFDTHLRLPVRSRLVRSARPRTPVLVISGRASGARRRLLEGAGVEVVAVPTSGGRVSLPRALTALRARGLTSLMVEGGSELLGAFLARRQVDHVALFRAPVLLGGRRSLSAFGGPDPRRLEEALRLRPVPDDPPFPWPGPRLFELWTPETGGRRA
jgi:diaminohydroxyphosphoribosylaminopyrimidine deaminase/5-amino-6-(5-phosphoribosylamino)uracil reductase